MTARSPLSLQLGALIWGACAFAFARWRVPYDDEWFSIELALQAEPQQFWQALRGDIHPPWTALFDRWVARLWPERSALHLARVIVSAVAVVIGARWLARRLDVPAWALWLAACHPIVFMYAGSARWYPVLFLAHSLRAYALWADDGGHRRHAAFVAGGALGGAVGPIDLLFLAHDCVYWMVRSWSHARPERVRAWLTAGMASAAALGWYWLSPLGPLTRTLGTTPSARKWLGWLSLGVLGEAGPSLPWLFASAVLPVVLARGVLRLVATKETRAFGLYVTSCGAAWTLSTAFGVWHPRYSLWFWLLLSACAIAALRSSRLDRILLCAAAGYVCLVLGYMGAERGYFKSDLNGLTRRDCAALAPTPELDLVVVPYRRLADLVQTRCGLHAPVQRIASIRIVADELLQMQPLEQRLSAAPRGVWSLHLSASSSLTHTDKRVWKTLGSRCRMLGSTGFGTVAHRELKLPLLRRIEPHRFVLMRWKCAP